MKASMATHWERQERWASAQIAPVRPRAAAAARKSVEAVDLARKAGNAAYAARVRAKVVDATRSATTAPHPRHLARMRAHAERAESRARRRARRARSAAR